ncbi:hypothetical protein WMF27_26560 [Sorangium sp. So ce281]|uniref:hypothetical protein n=1 Tax=unclassified Sorangium TaxID=2621164 RepID=UPI003F617926
MTHSSPSVGLARSARRTTPRRAARMALTSTRKSPRARVSWSAWTTTGASSWMLVVTSQTADGSGPKTSRACSIAAGKGGRQISALD